MAICAVQKRQSTRGVGPVGACRYAAMVGQYTVSRSAADGEELVGMAGVELLTCVGMMVSDTSTVVSCSRIVGGCGEVMLLGFGLVG